MKYQPLLPVELDHVVPDELHLLLRIIDVLLENIINQAVESDIKVCSKQADPLQGAILKKMVSKIQSCGVSFSIWRNSGQGGNCPPLRGLKIGAPPSTSGAKN